MKKIFPGLFLLAMAFNSIAQNNATTKTAMGKAHFKFRLDGSGRTNK